MARGLQFEWDARKAKANLRKHGVSFEEASTLFSDPDELMLPDPDHSEHEQRFISIGRTTAGQLMLGCYTEKQDVIRIISARRADAAERRIYERSQYDA